MRVLTAALKELIRLGVEGEALIAAIERLEAAAYEDSKFDLNDTVDISTAREDLAFLRARRAKDRERKRNVSTEIPRNSAENLPPEEKVSSAPPLKTQPPTTPLPPLKGVVSPHQKRALRRAPGGWQPSSETLAKLGGEGFSPGDLERALTRMRDHEFATGRTDWDATFRNWVRRDADQNPRKANGIRPHHNDAAQRSEDRMRRIIGGAQIAAGIRPQGFRD